ncbi:MAG: hypothetical protein JO253_08950 [Alphaproteobacteria bacterium]|nr:hypothetical protein [Alphaproteobacteria bacterium]
MTDTSYNPGFAPYARWSVEQAPVPATTHNLPTSIAASGTVQTSLIVTEGFTLISAGLTSTQAGTLSIQRYLDAGGAVPQGAAVSVALTATSAANLDVLDGKPFASFILTVTNSNGSSAATLNNFALLLQTSASNSPNTGVANNTVSVSGQAKIIVTDPTTGNGALVTAFHNADNQSLGTVYGIMTGGVDQLLNGSGNLDRKRGVAGDGMAGTGLAAEVPMLWNGTSYDRAPGSAANGMKVQVGNSVAVTGTFWQATQPVSGTFWQTTQPVSLTGNAATDGSTTLTTGGTAQNLFGGTVPTNGYAICNPDPSNDLWVSDSTTAAANGVGSIRVAANGGYYATEAGQRPLGAVSVYGATTGQKITARRW